MHIVASSIFSLYHDSPGMDETSSSLTTISFTEETHLERFQSGHGYKGKGRKNFCAKCSRTPWVSSFKGAALVVEVENVHLVISFWKKSWWCSSTQYVLCFFMLNAWKKFLSYRIFLRLDPIHTFSLMCPRQMWHSSCVVCSLTVVNLGLCRTLASCWKTTLKMHEKASGLLRPYRP